MCNFLKGWMFCFYISFICVGGGYPQECMHAHTHKVCVHVLKMYVCTSVCGGGTWEEVRGQLAGVLLGLYLSFYHVGPKT